MYTKRNIKFFNPKLINMMLLGHFSETSIGHIFYFEVSYYVYKYLGFNQILSIILFKIIVDVK